MKEGKPVAVPKYKRVLVKISGEAIAGPGDKVLGFDVIGVICDVLKRCLDAGVQIGIVVGGGNIWRGAKDGADRMDRTRADHMGMLATAINSLALADVMESRGVEVRVQTAIEMRAVAEPYVRLRAIAHLNRGRVVVFGCGTGNPFFSTDTAAVLRGAEIGAEIVLLAKNVDGVYSDDPKKNPDARKYEELTHSDFLRDNLAAMDATAASLSRDNDIPVILFALKDPENIYRAVMGEKVGTLVR
jgi:uridylate kinase